MVVAEGKRRDTPRTIGNSSVNAKDITVSDLPRFEFPDDPPTRFQGASVSEMKKIQFRCPHCGIACRAVILPQSPQIAKFRCRQCENTVEVETRPSAMDSIEQEFDLRLDMKHSGERGKAFSLPTSPSGIILARR